MIAEIPIIRPNPVITESNALLSTSGTTSLSPQSHIDKHLEPHSIARESGLAFYESAVDEGCDWESIGSDLLWRWDQSGLPWYQV